jgi:hypothetical protein
MLSLSGGFINAKGTDGQQPLLVSDYLNAFKSNTLVVVGDGSPHGPKGKYSLTIDGLCGAWIAVKLAEYFEAPGIVTDSDITSWQGKTVDLLDHTHNLIVVGCHWVNIVSYHYFFMRRDLVPVYPANYLNDDPLVFPEFLVKKSTGERFAYWNAIQDKYKTTDYAVMVALRDGDRNVLILWAYWEYGTIAMAKILQNINSASSYGWRLNSEAVFVTWNDAYDDDKVQLNEITTEPLFERAQTTTFNQVVTTVFTATDTVGFMKTGNIYDDSGIGFIYAHRKPPRILFPKTDASKISAIGQPTWSGYTHLVTVGGRNANPTTRYYEDSGLAPLKWAGTGTNAIIMSGSEVKLNVPLSSLGSTNDYFVMQIIVDGTNRIIVLWGITQYGTYASGVYFDGIFASLSTLTQGWYIVRWQDLNSDGVQNYPDEFTIVAGGT